MNIRDESTNFSSIGPPKNFGLVLYHTLLPKGCSVYWNPSHTVSKNGFDKNALPYKGPINFIRLETL